jgi:hypothetical protein
MKGCNNSRSRSLSIINPLASLCFGRIQIPATESLGVAVNCTNTRIDGNRSQEQIEGFASRTVTCAKLPSSTRLDVEKKMAFTGELGVRAGEIPVDGLSPRSASCLGLTHIYERNAAWSRGVRYARRSRPFSRTTAQEEVVEGYVILIFTFSTY